MTSHIVILGGGFGGAYTAQALTRRWRGLDVSVTLVDRHNYLVFHPLLMEAGTGSLEPRHAVVPIRDFLPRRRAEFIMGEVTGVDVKAQKVDVLLGDGLSRRRLDYDHVVIALGSITRLPEEGDVPGARRHAFEMKNLVDAVSLRDRGIAMLELANAADDAELRRELLHFVVVGGNFTGVEVAGEFDMFLRRAARRYANVQAGDCRVTLLELSDRILAPLGPELSAYATAHLRKRGMDIRLKTTASSVMEREVALTDGSALRTRTVIWCAGIEPSGLLDRINVPKDGRGYMVCERDLRVKGLANVWGVGDCAVKLDAQGRPYPATAQLAIKQGRHAAKNIAALLRGRATTPCDITSQGSLAALGCRTGVADVMGIKLSGFAAWWLWRTVYLMKMPGLARKARVALDWTLDLLFPAADVALGLHRLSRSEQR